jgi:uncharacterized damage-inducible protein DinB
MAAYNAEMNRRIYGAAAPLGEDARRLPRGAFWGSIHGTLSHLLFADSLWMSRFDGWAKPSGTLKESATFIMDFDDLRAKRTDADEKILAWAQRVDDDWLSKDQNWFSGALGADVSQPRGAVAMHFFNHQTHHRGQAHAMITAAGGQTGDTDLFLVVPV